MDIIIQERKNGKLHDSIEYILNTNNTNFNDILHTLKDVKGVLNILYEDEIDNYDMTREIVYISSLLKELSELKTDKIDKEKQKRIHKLLKCRNERALKKLICMEYKLSKEDVEDIFKVLGGQQDFSEFINRKKIEGIHNTQKTGIFHFFKKKRNNLLLGDGNIPEDFFLGIMGRIACRDFSCEFFLKNASKYQRNYNLIEKKLKAEKDAKQHEIVLSDRDEPNWEINQELKDFVYKDMPENLTAEEKAVWIYMKLCTVLHYNDEKFFDENWSCEINTSMLENIKPNSYVVCYDFSRVYAKFINTMEDSSIEAKVVGSKNHFFVNVFGKDIIMSAEATNAIDNSNDFFKARMGLPIKGISVLYDPKHIIKKSIDKITPLIYKNRQKSLDYYIYMLNAIRDDEKKESEDRKEEDLCNKFKSLTKTMKQNSVHGLEAMQGIINFSKLGFFGDKTDVSWIKWKTFNKGKKPYYKSGVIVCQKESEQFYLLDCSSMNVIQISREDLIEKFKSQEISYENPEYVIDNLKEDLQPKKEDENKPIGENMEI